MTVNSMYRLCSNPWAQDVREGVTAFKSEGSNYHSCAYRKCIHSISFHDETGLSEDLRWGRNEVVGYKHMAKRIEIAAFLCHYIDQKVYEDRKSMNQSVILSTFKAMAYYVTPKQIFDITSQESRLHISIIPDLYLKKIYRYPEKIDLDVRFRGKFVKLENLLNVCDVGSKVMNAIDSCLEIVTRKATLSTLNSIGDNEIRPSKGIFHLLQLYARCLSNLKFNLERGLTLDFSSITYKLNLSGDAAVNIDDNIVNNLARACDLIVKSKKAALNILHGMINSLDDEADRFVGLKKCHKLI